MVTRASIKCKIKRGSEYARNRDGTIVICRNALNCFLGHPKCKGWYTVTVATSRHKGMRTCLIVDPGELEPIGGMYVACKKYNRHVGWADEHYDYLPNELRYLVESLGVGVGERFYIGVKKCRKSYGKAYGS